MTPAEFEKLLDDFGNACCCGDWDDDGDRQRVLDAYAAKCDEADKHLAFIQDTTKGFLAARAEAASLREALYLINAGPAVAGFAEAPDFEEWAKHLAERALAPRSRADD